MSIPLDEIKEMSDQDLIDQYNTSIKFIDSIKKQIQDYPMAPDAFEMQKELKQCGDNITNIKEELKQRGFRLRKIWVKKGEK